MYLCELKQNGVYVPRDTFMVCDIVSKQGGSV